MNFIHARGAVLWRHLAILLRCRSSSVDLWRSV